MREPGRRFRAKLYLAEWREVVVLLAGVLHQQGRLKVDGLVSAVLEDLGKSPTLAASARCAGLLGVIFRDLKPLGYEPANAGYQRLIDDVEAIFDVTRSQSVPVQDRFEAAEALGQAGDPRIDPRHPKYWVTIPSGAFLMGSQTNCIETRPPIATRGGSNRMLSTEIDRNFQRVLNPETHCDRCPG